MMNLAILGSTGSIGETTLNIIRKNKNNFKIKLLSTNTNIKKIYHQAIEFNVKNIVINNKKINNYWKMKFNEKNINIFHDFDNLTKLFKKKLNYVMNAISGIDGLEPTLKIIKHTNKIAIANKESIICGWNLINNQLKKNRTTFIPVDSEHFSIHKLIDKDKNDKIKHIILTASGGPFLNKKINYKNVKIKDALKHPNWKMGKKISIDSATMMNKVFEVIEAKKIFNLNIDQIKILINPNSYLHAIIIFKNGTIKILAHETKMDIPIFNSIYENTSKYEYETKNLNLKKMNSLCLAEPNIKKFPSLKILKKISKKDTLFETILITVNDELVKKFLNGEIKFENISIILSRIINFKKFKKYCIVKPKSIEQIFNVRNLAKRYVYDYVKKYNI